MDGRTLMDIMQSPNWSMVGPANDSFQLELQKQKADVAQAEQTTRQAAEMHPLKMEAERAQTAERYGLARQYNAQSATAEDALKVLQGVPMDQRVAAATADMYQKIAAGDKAKISASMLKGAQYAATALSQGGKLSLPQMTSLQQDAPELVQYFQHPNGAKLVSNMVTAFNALDAERQKSDSAHRISAGATIQAAQLQKEAHLQGIDKEITAGKYDRYRKDYMMLQLLQRNPAEYYAQQRQMIAQELPGLDPEEAKAAKAMYDQYTQMETVARQQAAIAATAGANVRAGGTVSIDAIGSGQGLQAVPGVNAPQPVPMMPSNAPMPQPGPKPGEGAVGNKRMSPEAYTKWKAAAKSLNPNLTEAQIEAEAQRRGYK